MLLRFVVSFTVSIYGLYNDLLCQSSEWDQFLNGGRLQTNKLMLLGFVVSFTVFCQYKLPFGLMLSAVFHTNCCVIPSTLVMTAGSSVFQI
jgi:hypothetical protein